MFSQCLLVGEDRLLRDLRPCVTRLHEPETGGSHASPCLGILQHVSQGGCNFLRVQGDNMSRPELGHLGEMAGVGDDYRIAAGHRFQDRNTKTFLAAGQAETSRAAECRVLPVTIQGPDEMHARFEAGASNLSPESFPGSCVGARYDKMHVRKGTMNDFKSRAQIIEPLFVVQTAEEKHGAFSGETVSRLERNRRWSPLQVLRPTRRWGSFRRGRSARAAPGADLHRRSRRAGRRPDRALVANRAPRRFASSSDFCRRHQGSSMPCGVTM